MATYKSNIVSAYDDKAARAEQRIAGTPNVKICHAALTTKPLTTDTIILCRVGVNTKLTSLLLSNDAFGTSAAINVGFHKIANENDLGEAIDADALGTAVDVASAADSTEIRFETQGIETVGKAAYELAGLSAVPDYGEMFITATPSTSASAAGDLVLIVQGIE